MIISLLQSLLLQKEVLAAIVGALVGAFAAYLLVVLTDWRRNRRKKKTLVRLIEINQRMAKSKEDAVTATRNALTDSNKMVTSPIIRFSVEDIKRIEADVLDMLGEEEKLTLTALCYLMQETDGVLNDAYARIQKIIELRLEGEEIDGSHPLRAQILIDYGDALANLKRFRIMADLFIDKKYAEILSK